MKKKMIKRLVAISVAAALSITSVSITNFTAVKAEVPSKPSLITNETEKLEDIFTTIELMDATIDDLSTAMESGELTAERLVQLYIDRIETYDKSLNLNSIIMINPNAIEEAKELDKERAAGNIKGKLHGIPIIVKDNYDVKGLPTTAGCLALSNSIAPDDSYAVKKLKEQGAIILAKANMSEFASSGSNSRSTKGGVVHNSYDTERTAAGSSGGTAVAVTANFCAAGLGTDTGSSIRRPSSFSNLYGIRPSKGLTSIDGVVPLNEDRDVTGPLCRTPEDLALILETIAGTDSADHYTVEADADSLITEGGYLDNIASDGLNGKKIGYLANSFGYTVGKDDAPLEENNTITLDPKISAMVEKAKRNLQKGGATLVDISSLIPESLITSLRQGTSYSVFEWDVNKYFASLGPDAPVKTAYELINNYTYGVDYTNFSVKNPSPVFADMTNPRSTEGWTAMWNKMVTFRETISNILEENNIDAVVFISQTDVADIETTSNNKNNGASYLNYFGPVAGLPEMMIPMGMSKTDPDAGYEHSMPLGMSMFTSYGNEQTLFDIACAYKYIAGSSIRELPYTVPALEDDEVNKFLEQLMEKVDALDFSKYSVYPNGSINTVLNKYEVASAVDTSDIYATYDAAYNLAVAYDRLTGKLAGNEIPEATSTPDPTATPETTKVPEATVSPAPTMTPEATKAPEATVSPAPTMTPEATKVPEATVSPAPTASVAPSATPEATAFPVPAKVVVKKIAKVKGGVKVTLKNASNVAGYQVIYSTSKKFKASNSKKLTLKTSSFKISRLKLKKTYYIKVRAFNYSGNKKQYSKWSAIKKQA